MFQFETLVSGHDVYQPDSIYLPASWRCSCGESDHKSGREGIEAHRRDVENDYPLGDDA